MTHFHRAVRGTALPHLTARPISIDVGPAPDGGLAGAACQGLDPDLFFPDEGDAFATRRAKNTCATCPVRDMCLALALERNEKHGIFGGLGPLERALLPATHPARRAVA